MPDTPVFQGHHLIEQAAFKDSRLLQELARRGLFELHGEVNILNLPADQSLAAKMGISPHPGGPLGDYSDQLALLLEDLERSSDGRAALGQRVTPEQQAAAAQRMAARIENIDYTLRAGILNGDLVTNTPEGMTPAEANAKVRTFFADLDGYQRTHAAQIAELKNLEPAELRWRGVTQSEANVKLALDAIDQPGNSTLSERWGGRASLGAAIEEANQAGRLPLTEHTAARVRTAFNPEMPLTIARPAPTAPELAGTAGRTGAVEGAAEAAATRGQMTGARVLGAAGVAALAVDFAITGHRVAELRSEGNEAGAKSAGTHFVGRTVGGFGGGFLLGAGYGAVTGSWTGPGALATSLIGGVAGGFAGEYWAQYQDKKAVYTQVDRSGNEWSREPEDPTGTWSRSVRTPQPDGSYRDTTVVAGGRLVDELNYKAANDSYSLGMANLPRPQDPFKLDAQVDSTSREPFEVNRHYVRNAQNGQWHLSIHEMVDGRVPNDRAVAISPEKSAELELESQRIIAQNAANTPEALAARYQVAFNQYGWNEFASIEPVPEVITNAQTQTQPLRASNGEKYTQDANGQWHTPGWVYGTNPAEGNIIEELNRTRESQQAGVQELTSMADIARANPTPTEYGLRGQVVDAYRRAGVPRNAEEIDAAVAAVAQDHARDMPGNGTYMLQVQKDGSIATLVGKDDERMEVVSTTTPAEIEQARTRPAASPDAPAPSSVTPPATPDRAEVDRRHSMAPRPEDAGLLEQLRSSVATLDEKHHKPWDRSSDHLLASAYRLAVEAGFKPGDKVEMALNEATESRAAGTTMFVTRSGPGASPDPAANRAHMPTQEALAAAPEQQYAAANNSRGAQELALAQAQTQDQQQREEQTHQGPRLA
ncbi:XVIPCD domain-containing protein [Stenotrophomonas sp. PS02289]|uniref:XVIPCD domain-containing protein n=1 Tax=Stenotrophomonas sp. PS02289 TaxID=2991422 RepID=UPI00249BEA57|nr:XVIPCD domain-containing protein [Stenotrophomonas sp. PS02289]